MNSMLKAAAIALACACAVGFIVWRRTIEPTRSITRSALLVDPSGSASSVCDSVESLVERALAAHAAGSDFHLMLFRIGDSASANEPVLIKQYTLRVNRRVMESQHAATQLRNELIADIRTQCAGLAAAETSPVFFGIKQVVAQLRVAGCTGDANCQLFIQSDLQETVERSIKDALTSVSGRRDNLPAAIENDGVQITVCGLSQTIGQAANARGNHRQLTRTRDPRQSDRLKEIWSQLFTQRIVMEQFCTRPEAPARARASAR